MEKIKQLKEFYDEGLMSKEEYDERRLQVINDMTKTDYSEQNEKNDSRPSEQHTVLLDGQDDDTRWGADAETQVVADPPPTIMR
jgi:hypothetical protein